MAATNVQGSMKFVDSDSSDTDSDDEVQQTTSVPGLKHDSDQEPEEKLEVFKIISLETLTVEKTSAPVPKKSLVELMADAAASVAAGVVPTIPVIECASAPASIPIQGDGFGITRADIRSVNESGSVAEEVPDLFGIAYKPYKANKPSYALNTGPPDTDDVELQIDLQKLHLIAQSVNIQHEKESEDDDFNFDLSSLAKEQTASASGAHMHSFPLNADAEELAIFASMRAESDATAQENLRAERSESRLLVSASASTPASLVSMAAAHDAMAAVSSIYMPGAAGDMQARLDIEHGESVGQAPKAITTATTATKLKPVSKASFAITEGDEEDEEVTGQGGADKAVADCSSNPIPLEERSQRSACSPSTGVGEDVRMSAEELAWENLVEPAAAVVPSNIANVSYAQLLAHLQAIPLQHWHSKIISHAPRTKSLLGRLGLGSGPRIGKVDKLAGALSAQLDWPFLLAQQPWDPSDEVQLGTLRTIFYRLIPDYSGISPLPPTGPHWDLIGFQGMDPSTDINRAMKLLAVLQCLHITEAEHLADARNLHALSLLDPTHPNNTSPEGSGRGGVGKRDLSWPFFCVSISFTKEALIALRTGELNGYCNSLGGVLNCLHAFYRACFHDFRSHMMTESSTHHAEHLAALRKRCADSPIDMLKRYFLSTGAVSKIAPPVPNTSAPYAHQSKAPAQTPAAKDANHSGFLDFNRNVSASDSDNRGHNSSITGKAARFLA
jgi:hypothetical protein